MNLMLYKDGRLVMNEQGKPLEGQESDLRNLYAYITDPADGDTLVYDGTAGCWKAGQGGGSFAPDISDPQDGDTLVYNAAQQKWVNGAGGSGSGAFIVHLDDVTMAADKTWQEIFDASTNTAVVFVGSMENTVYVWYLTDIGAGEGEYYIGLRGGEDFLSMTLVADSADEYPVIQGE